LDDADEGLLREVPKKLHVGPQLRAQRAQTGLFGAAADDRQRLSRQRGRAHQRLDALEPLQTPAVDEALADRAVGLKLLDVDEVRNVDKAIALPSPLHQLVQHEPARHDEAADVGVIQPKQAVNERFDHDQAAERERSLDAAMNRDVMNPAAAAALARLVRRHHGVGGARELEIMNGHDDRNPGLAQGRQDRGREVMIDVVRMGDARAHPLEQLAQPPARLQREDHALRMQELGCEPVTAAKLDLVGKVLGPGGGQVLRVPHRERDDLPTGALEQAILLEKKHLGAAARVEIVVDRQETGRRLHHPDSAAYSVIA
jgi:hypothetical protein